MMHYQLSVTNPSVCKDILLFEKALKRFHNGDPSGQDVIDMLLQIVFSMEPEQFVEVVQNLSPRCNGKFGRASLNNGGAIERPLNKFFSEEEIA